MMMMMMIMYPDHTTNPSIEKESIITIDFADLLNPFPLIIILFTALDFFSEKINFIFSNYNNILNRNIESKSLY